MKARIGVNGYDERPPRIPPLRQHRLWMRCSLHFSRSLHSASEGLVINFKCAVPSCYRNAVSSHVVCNFHLFVEIASTVLVAGGLMWGVLYLVLTKIK